AHAEYVRRLSGFQVAGIAHSGTEALRLLQASLRATPGERVDLILLDMNLPDLRGLEVARRLRSSGITVDVIAVTAVRDVTLVREAISLGVLMYLMKPFTFATFAEKLRSYQEFRAGFDGDQAVPTQTSVDQTMANLRNPTRIHLDKGLTHETLDRVTRSIPNDGSATSAAQLALELGVSRVTARRYLEHLVEQGLVERTARYGTQGRPEIEYRRRSDAGGRR
ncbi:MAG TPA: response regulator, partial [Propionibacteriaceae bacterium]|nr:response regulator [Propionibacteriaceae bacterium]